MIFKEILDKVCPKGVIQVQLEELVSESRERNKACSFSDVRSVSARYGLISTNEYFDNSPASKETSAYKVVRPGMFAYNPARINIGSIAFSSLQQPVIVSPMYIVFSVDEKKVNPHYLLTWMKSNRGIHEISSRVEVGARFRLPISTLKKISVPLPPLSVQIEIVNKLRTLQQLIAKLNEEILLREKQFEIIHNKLFDNLSYAVPVSIGELFEFKNGLNKGKEFFGKGSSIINYTDVYRNRFVRADDIGGKVQLDEKEIERYKVKKGDVFFTRTSETKEEVGLTSVLLNDIENCTFSGFLLRARPKTDKILPEFCQYCFTTKKIRKEIIKSSTITTRALTNGTTLSKIRIDLPSLDMQSSIVGKLDAFTSLITKLQEERDLRQKQYEYYREKLLTFE